MNCLSAALGYKPFCGPFASAFVPRSGQFFWANACLRGFTQQRNRCDGVQRSIETAERKRSAKVLLTCGFVNVLVNVRNVLRGGTRHCANGLVLERDFLGFFSARADGGVFDAVQSFLGKHVLGGCTRYFLCGHPFGGLHSCGCSPACGETTNAARNQTWDKRRDCLADSLFNVGQCVANACDVFVGRDLGRVQPLGFFLVRSSLGQLLLGVLFVPGGFAHHRRDDVCGE